MINNLLNGLINIYVILIIVRAILSWVPDLRWRFRQVAVFLDNVTDPVLKPLQRLVPPRKTGGLDLSPILAIVILRLIQQFIL